MERVYDPSHLYGDKSAGAPQDSKPMQVPSGLQKPITMEERLQRFMRLELSRVAQEQGFESFEESQDFDIPDDPVDPSTPFEEFFDPVLGKAITPMEMEKFEAEYREQYLKAQGDKIAFEDREAAIREHVEQLRKAKKQQPPGGGGVAPPPLPRPRRMNPSSVLTLR